MPIVEDKQQTKLFDDVLESDYFDQICATLDIDDGHAWPDNFGTKLLEWIEKQNSKPIKTLSLFSGLGGLDIGFHDAGFQVTTLVEIDERFAKTLDSNSGNTKYLGECDVLCMDIRDFDPADIDYEFIIGGPPCQSFSAAARRASGVSGVNDDRGTLFKEYARLLSTIQPKGFLFENVYGITGANRGEAWAAIQAEFEAVGYTLSHRILDAADYGVPQHRERMFIVGLRKDVDDFLFPYPTHGPDALAARGFYTAGDAVDRANVSKEEQSKRITGRYGGLLEQIPEGLNYSFFTEKMGHPKPVFAWRSKFSDFLYKADRNTPVRTLKAQGGQYTGPFHWDNRPFSICELKRLQTLPDAYQIEGGVQVKIHQIGNSVPPQLARILAMAVRDQIFQHTIPSPIQYMPQKKQLGFRRRKRALTSTYQSKASAAIAGLEAAEADYCLEAGCYSAKLTANFDFSVTTTKSDLKIYVTATDNAWNFHAALKGSHWRRKAFQLYIQPIDDWNLPCKEVILSTNDFSNRGYTAAWKAFEAELIASGLKADLVQLCGYYQYEPSFNVRFVSSQDTAEPRWNRLALVVEGIGIQRTLEEEELAQQWNCDLAEVLPTCMFLRDLGYEVRNATTNGEIPQGHFLIPYAFPTLTPQSVQLRKSLNSEAL